MCCLTLRTRGPRTDAPCGTSNISSTSWSPAERFFCLAFQNALLSYSARVRSVPLVFGLSYVFHSTPEFDSVWLERREATRFDNNRHASSSHPTHGALSVTSHSPPPPPNHLAHDRQPKLVHPSRLLLAHRLERPHRLVRLWTAGRASHPVQ